MKNNNQNMTESELLYVSIGEGLLDAQKSQMFGKPCLKTNGKAFVCFFEGAMVFKLTGEKHSEALSFNGAQLFDPSRKNRPMKEWVQVPFDYKDHWESLAAEALKYVNDKFKASL